jgi:hypothetical protein
MELVSWLVIWLWNKFLLFPLSVSIAKHTDAIFSGLLTRQNLHRGKRLIQESELPNIHSTKVRFPSPSAMHYHPLCVSHTDIHTSFPTVARKANVVSMIRFYCSKDLSREREGQKHWTPKTYTHCLQSRISSWFLITNTAVCLLMS